MSRLTNRRKTDKNSVFVLSLVIVTTIIIISFFIFAIKKVESVYSDQMYQNALETRKAYLKDTVNNLITDLENQQDEYTELFANETEEVRVLMQTYLDTHEVTASQLATYLEKTSGMRELSYVVYDTATGEDYGTGNISRDSADDKLLCKAEVNKGTLHVIFGVSREYMNAVIRNAFALRLKTYDYEDGSYVWVDTVTGEGEEAHFKREIHPGYPESEGQVFGTDTKDEDGNKYYLEIANGLEEEGEVFVAYFYREKKSDLISKKISYVKYYPEYNWAIGMGVPSHAIVHFVQDMQAENRPMIIRFIVMVTAFFAIVFVLCMVFILQNDRKHFKKRVRALRHDVEVDELTGASTRKYGARLLEEAYLDFKDGNESTVLMLLDVDKFKSVNDTYGHEAGDEVLKKVVSTMKKNIRSSDYLIRWGGDEFVGIFPNLTRSELEAVAKKLLFAVSDLRVNSNGQVVKVTVSLGFTYFHNDDEGYQDALNRADEGLYESKEGGRNQFNITI